MEILILFGVGLLAGVIMSKHNASLPPRTPRQFLNQLDHIDCVFHLEPLSPVEPVTITCGSVP